ncbi:C-type mannose receptor 2-like [Acanthopagrus latus]|uniref:C-type mannose receptor 2-like n=1 Tax=Acanthopagrus latus TaxID=8177 RepID=UPI00187C4624|nr:C-type mannose receptor 2-like [Acanthopagrus latus]
MMMTMMMESGSSGLFLLLLLLTSGASGLGSVLWIGFNYYSPPYTWKNAQSFCRSHFVDLATIYTQDNTGYMNIEEHKAWIGLHRQYGNDSTLWYWSNGQLNYFWRWADNQPGNDDCAVVNNRQKKFYGSNCDGRNFFICHKMKSSGPEYTFVPQLKTWSEAREYCSNNFDDLATIKLDYQMDKAVLDWDYPVWTGLYRDGGTFKWSTGVSTFLDWASGEPRNNGDCVSILSHQKKMATQDCSALFPFVCLRDNLVLVKENKTWEEALEHCRGLDPSNPRYELLSIQPEVDHMYVMTTVMQRAVTEKVWTGLRFLAGKWLWVNVADQLYSDLPTCPATKDHCGALSKNDTGQMETTDCTERLNFLCYRRW